MSKTIDGQRGPVELLSSSRHCSTDCTVISLSEYEDSSWSWSSVTPTQGHSPAFWYLVLRPNRAPCFVKAQKHRSIIISCSSNHTGFCAPCLAEVSLVWNKKSPEDQQAVLFDKNFRRPMSKQVCEPAGVRWPQDIPDEVRNLHWTGRDSNSEIIPLKLALCDFSYR